jgi:hypothetical protein
MRLIKIIGRLDLRSPWNFDFLILMIEICWAAGPAQYCRVAEKGNQHGRKKEEADFLCQK